MFSLDEILAVLIGFDAVLLLFQWLEGADSGHLACIHYEGGKVFYSGVEMTFRDLARLVYSSPNNRCITFIKSENLQAFREEAKRQK